MNGYTPTVPVATRIQNLLEQIPAEYRARAIAECTHENQYDYERRLTGYVLSREWEMYAPPADLAYALEQADEGDLPEVRAEDPRTEWVRGWDNHCAEVQATRESDMPRGW